MFFCGDTKVNYINLLKASKSLNFQNFRDFEIILIIYQYQKNKNKIDNFLKKIFKPYLNIKIINIDTKCFNSKKLGNKKVMVSGFVFRR